MFSFLNRFFRIGAVSVEQILEKMESGREVELTKRDLKILAKDQDKVLESLAEVKTTILMVSKEIEAANIRQLSYENNAVALLNQDPEDTQSLAQKNAAEAEIEEEKILLLEQQLAQHQHLEEEIQGNLDSLQQALSSANHELKLMSSMVATKQSAEKVRGISGQGEGASNALNRIAERKKKLALDVAKTKAISEMRKQTKQFSLQEQTKQALGSKNTLGQKKLIELRKKLGK